MRFSLKFPLPRKEVLVINERPSRSIIDKIGLKEKEIFWLNLHNEPIWIWYLIKAVVTALVDRSVNVKAIKRNYVLFIIKHVSPIMIITSVDNDRNYWCLKSVFPDIYIVLIQNGLRGEVTLKTKESYYLACEKYYVDIVFLMAKDERKWYVNNGLSCDVFVVSGSVKNNVVDNCAANNKIDKIVYLLQYKDHDFRRANEINTRYLRPGTNDTFLSYDDLYKYNASIINFLIDFASKYRFQLVIFGRAKTSSSASREQSYLRSLLPGVELNYEFCEGDLCSYEYLKNSKCLVTMSSTLGYEMLARGIRTFFLGVRYEIFGYPEIFCYGKYGHSGEFWVDTFDSSELESKIRNLIVLTDEEWLCVRSKYSASEIVYDYNNQILRNTLKNLMQDSFV